MRKSSFCLDVIMKQRLNFFSDLLFKKFSDMSFEDYYIHTKPETLKLGNQYCPSWRCTGTLEIPSKIVSNCRAIQ